MNERLRRELLEEIRGMREKLDNLEWLILSNDSSMLEMDSAVTDKALNRLISAYLLRLGFPAQNLGFEFTKMAMFKIIKNEKLLGNITNELYKEIAEDYNLSLPEGAEKTRKCRVERAIRYGIECSWDKGDQELIKKIFGYTKADSTQRPTNGRFCGSFFQYLKLHELS